MAGRSDAGPNEASQRFVHVYLEHSLFKFALGLAHTMPATATAEAPASTQFTRPTGHQTPTEHLPLNLAYRTRLN